MKSLPSGLRILFQLTKPGKSNELLAIALTKPLFYQKIVSAVIIRGISSAGRARGSQSRGQGFDPPKIHQSDMGGVLHPAHITFW